MAPSPQGAAGPCLDDEAIAGFLEARLPEAERAAATEHLSTCAVCREQCTELARLEHEESESYRSLVFDEEGHAVAGGTSVAELSVGSSLGRYVLLGKVGEGGMGVVYAAFDPELNRRVAVKVIRSEVASTTEEAKQQLREEARAMAQLTHPNVVRVYDVGRQGELVYIAMEYVDGVDLRRFASRHRDDWRRVLDACLQAGRGLIAAHQAGLVHRDFKPGNVLCANDGRVLVADFGLTRLLRTDLGDGDDAGTRPAGTPGYVAPEQAQGLASTALSDQYSYCVAVAECLLGTSPAALASSEGETQPPSDSPSAPGAEPATAVPAARAPRGRRGPRGLGVVLRRGMAKEPGARFASMQHLLTRLQRVSRRRQRLSIILTLLALASILGVIMFVLGQRAQAPESPCMRSTAPVAQVWNDERQSLMARRLASSPYQGHARHFMASLGDATRALALEHAAACKATFETHEESAQLYDRQMLCLGSQLTQLGAVVAMVEGGGSVETAQTALSKLDPPGDCQPDETMRNIEAPPRDPELRAQMQEVEEALAECKVHAHDDEGTKALLAGERAISLAREIGYGPLLARALLAQSEILVGIERFADGKKAVEEARDVAARSRDTLMLIRTLLQLADIAATHEDNAAEGSGYIETARAIGLGTPLPPYYQAVLHWSASVVARAAENPKLALSEATLGLDKLSEAPDQSALPRGLELRISLLSVVASAQFDSGDYEGALQRFATIVVLQRKRLGPEHSGIASSLANLATVQYKMGQLNEAHTTLTEARSRLTSPDASQSVLARCLNLEGLILNRLERVDEAVAVHREAIKVQTEVYGVDHRMVWATKNNLANVLVQQEKWAEAISLHEEQVAWATERGGKESPKAISANINLANTLANGAKSDADLARATALLDDVLPLMSADDRRRVNVLSIQGQTFFGLGKFPESATAYRAAIDLGERTPNTRESLKAYLYSRLAESIWREGKKREALEAAHKSLDIYEGLPEKVEARRELEAWVAEHENTP